MIPKKGGWLDLACPYYVAVPSKMTSPFSHRGKVFSEAVQITFNNFFQDPDPNPAKSHLA
jgi:hypothetical protein